MIFGYFISTRSGGALYCNKHKLDNREGKCQIFSSIFMDSFLVWCVHSQADRSRSRSRITLRRRGLKPSLSQMPKGHQTGSSPETVGGWLQLLTHRGQGFLQVAPAELWGNNVKTFSVLWDENLRVSLQWFGFIPLKYFHSFLGNFSPFPYFHSVQNNLLQSKRFSECFSKMKGVFCETVHSFEDLWVYTHKSKCGSVFVQAIYTPSELRAELMFHLRLK